MSKIVVVSLLYTIDFVHMSRYCISYNSPNEVRLIAIEGHNFPSTFLESHEGQFLKNVKNKLQILNSAT